MESFYHPLDRPRSFSLWVWLCALILVSLPVQAEEDWSLPVDLQIQGFLSQAFVKTNHNRFYGPSDKGSWDFREIGLNAGYQPQPHVRFAGQLLSRTAGEMSDGGVELDYALVDLTPVIQEDRRMGIRLGRMKNPLGLYNATRDVPFTRPSIFLPQSIYFDKVRNLELSVDGGGLYADWQGGRSDLFLELYGGLLRVDGNVENAFLFFERPGHLSGDEPWVSGRLMYELDGGRLRLALSGARGEMQYEPAANDDLQAGTVKVEFWIASAQYNAENWSLTAEYMRELVNYRDFGLPIFLNNHASGKYVQGAYHLTPEWELFVRYDVSYFSDEDKKGERQSAVTGAPAHFFFAKDLTFGVRWDPMHNLMLRAEYHRVDGASWLSGVENNPIDIVRKWDMFALQASYRF